VTLAQLSPGFTINWTLADNSTRTLNQADMIATGVALGVHVQTQFARAQGLRLQIEAASTPGQVAAVVW
jgi:D-alanyl-D-alanine dipeptidase